METALKAHSHPSLADKTWSWPTLRANPASPVNQDLPGWLVNLLDKRGIRGAASLENYLQPKLQHLDDPQQIADMPVATTRLIQAIKSQEKIVIYGDYDVDGVCSTAILATFLRHMGAQASYYIPDRRTEGYGINAQAIAELASKNQVIITVDCGITAYDEIDLAKQLGVDVIVVDHHQVPDKLPPAIANLNPHRPDCPYPFKQLCAAGVAFMLVVALRRALREYGFFAQRDIFDVRHLLDLVALATVADMVPLQGTNRVLVAAGLKQLASSRCVGLKALCAVAKISPSTATANDLAFCLGPRINARGRMSQANLAVELLLTTDENNAYQLAKNLDEANEQRRQIEKTTVQSAIDQIDNAYTQNLPAALLAHDPSWHPGVLGLVATRLVHRYHRPALVIGEGGKGSGRSLEGLDLHATLQAVSPYLERFGGHKAAAGVTINPQVVEPLRQALVAEVQKRLGAIPTKSTLRPDLEIDETMLTLNTVAALKQLAPFGQGNPQPLLVTRRLQVMQKQLVGQTHLKLRLGQKGSLEAIAFGFGEHLSVISQYVDAVFYLETNQYAGKERLQMRVVDLRSAV